MDITKDIICEFNRIILLLSQLEDEDYSYNLSIIGGSSIGQHVRHIFEFSECLVYGSKINLLNDKTFFSYDVRRRDHLIEQSISYATSNFQTMIERLDSEEINLNKELILIHRMGREKSLELITTFGRELLYILDHTIHHLAIIRIAIEAVYPWINLPKEFGFTASTIAAKAILTEN